MFYFHNEKIHEKFTENQEIIQYITINMCYGRDHT